MITPHRIAHELVRQMAADEDFNSSATDILGAAPRFFLDGDGDAGQDDMLPHVVAIPATSRGGIHGDDEFEIRLVASVRDGDGESCALVTDAGADGDVRIQPGAQAFDLFALAVREAAVRARPGAILEDIEADWDFAGAYPVRYVVYSLQFRAIRAFGD